MSAGVTGTGPAALWLGTVEYGAAWQLQRELAMLRAEGVIGDVLLLLEHPPTITLGRGSRREHLLRSADELEGLGIAVHEVNRGGDVTYHGPGQLVGYPILDLTAHGRDLHAYLRRLEGVLMGAVGRFGVEGRRFPPHTGVWVGDRKIAAIGVQVSRWVTTHGFALNVAPDMQHFELIVPCGIRDYGVTSLTAEARRPITVAEVIAPTSEEFSREFSGRGRLPADLGGRLSQRSQKILAAALDVSDSVC